MTKQITMTADQLRAALREAKAEALETAKTGGPLHSWLYDRAAFVKATPLKTHAHEGLKTK